MKKRIGRYQIDRETEPVGGLPAYLAFDPESCRNVVLECIPDAGSDAEEREQSREANRLKAQQSTVLRHAHIVESYEVVEDDGLLWVAHEPVQGDTLENLLCTESIFKDLISFVLYQTAGSLDYAHQLGVYHGRLAPAELLFQDDGTLRILGFWKPGLAASGTVSAFDPTHYAAPEQIRGLPPQAAADQYSLASIVYELLSGTPPFHGNAIAVRNRIVLDTPADPSGLNPSLGQEASAVLLRALSKSPDDRFVSCLKFVQALDDALETPPIWLLPEEYRGHEVGSGEAGAGQLEGEVTEALLRDVLVERPSPRKGLDSIRKHFKVAGFSAIGVIAAAVPLIWALNASPGEKATEELRVATASPPPAVTSQPYAYSLQARGGEGPYQWSVVDGSLPKGLTLAPDGVLKGRSEANGVFHVEVQVRGSGATPATATEQLSLTVKQGPRIKSADTLASAAMGREYSHPLGVEGGHRPYRWALTSGTVPPGLSLNAFSGFLAGRPEAVGTYHFSISVSDLFAATSTRSFELTVKPTSEGDPVERVAQAEGAAAAAPHSQ